jgi:hypothetical protein
MRTFTCRSTFLYGPGERGGKGGWGGGVEELQMKRGSFFYGGPDYIFIGPVEWIQQATSIPEARIGEKKKDQRTDVHCILKLDRNYAHLSR